MRHNTPTPMDRLLNLSLGLFRAPPGLGRITLAAIYGLLCHSLFAAAVLAMIVAMFFGLSQSWGTVPAPWLWFVNAGLIVQFPLVHSLLLSNHGRALLNRLAPMGHGPTLSTTTYAIIASVQLFCLFAFWTPSGIIWWQASGLSFWGLCVAYCAAWLALIKASYDAGAEVQSGALGWMSMVQKIKPVFPDMPTGGLFRFIRQPIYLSFALTLWTVPVWTPDQLLLAISLTGYCIFAPHLKERRFKRRYGDRFETYRKTVPYMLPRLSRRTQKGR